MSVGSMALPVLALSTMWLAVGPETSQAPCLRPTRAGTQVQGDVRICPGHYRIADPSERGVIVAAASGTRIELTGVTLESGDSVPARYTGIGVASRGVDGVTILGGADPRVPLRAQDRRRTRPPGERDRSLRESRPAAGLYTRAGRHGRPARCRSPRDDRDIRRRHAAPGHHRRDGHGSHLTERAERHRPGRCAGQLHRRQRRVGQYRMGPAPLAFLAQRNRAKQCHPHAPV